MKIIDLMTNDRITSKAYLALVLCCTYAVSKAVPVAVAGGGNGTVQQDLEIPENDKICQDQKGPQYVWDASAGGGVCVSCTSCGCDYQDPHCLKCIVYRILDCAQLGTTDQAHPDLTSPSVPTQTPEMVTDPMTPVSPEGNNGIIIGLVVAFGVVATILVLLVVRWMLKKLKKPVENQLPHGQQDTEAPAETHPMQPINYGP